MFITKKRFNNAVSLAYDKGIAKGYELGYQLAGKRAFVIGRDNLELSEVLKEADNILEENRN